MAEADDLSKLTWRELHELSQSDVVRAFVPSRELRETDYSLEEVLGEVRAVVNDVVRFHEESPQRGRAAFFPAQLVAQWRDRSRPMAAGYGGLGALASLFTGWFIQRPDRGDFVEDLDAVVHAMAGAPDEAELMNDLRAFVGGYLDGSITPEVFSRRLKKPRRFPRRERPRPRLRDPRAILIAETESTLKVMLSRAQHEPSDADGIVAWETFKRFAASR
jgi:hypothetical protein